jgi:hypothetical protein
MAKAVRFPRKLEVWVPESIADGFDMLAADQLLSISDHMRQALARYLAALGVSIGSPRPNGKHAPVAEHRAPQQ